MKKGFTLIELLIVIGIIVILAALTFVVAKPAIRFAEARNAERWTTSESISRAISNYQIDNDGILPEGIDDIASSVQVLGTDISGCDKTCMAETSVVACLDLSNDLIEEYLTVIPQDPSTGTEANTGYYVNVDTNNRLIVGACNPESSETITIQR